jgi:hypothetical protein
MVRLSQWSKTFEFMRVWLTAMLSRQPVYKLFQSLFTTDFLLKSAARSDMFIRPLSSRLDEGRTLTMDTRSARTALTEMNVNSLHFARPRKRACYEIRCSRTSTRAIFDLFARPTGTPIFGAQRIPLPDNRLATDSQHTARAKPLALWKPPNLP